MKTASSHIQPASKAAVTWYNARIAFPYIAIPLILMVVVGSLYRLKVQGAQEKFADMSGRPQQAGSAIVVSRGVIARSARNGEADTRVLLQMRIADHPATINASSEDNVIYADVGDVVPVTYCIGKSGAYYVVGWQAPPRKVSLPR